MPECQLQRKVKIPNRSQPLNQGLIHRGGFGDHYLNSAAITLYSIIENLVVWARSEIMGSALKKYYKVSSELKFKVPKVDVSLRSVGHITKCGWIFPI